MPTMKTADELIASVDATLDGWRVALDSSLSHGKETVALEAAAAADNKKTYLWEDSDKYFERLATFKPDTYFAKPLAISPLVCAAFGWENVGRDIIKCTHKQCKAALCIKFHPALDKESHANLCAKYLNLLASSHKDVCPFQSFAKRSLKVMERKSKTNNAVIIDVEEENSNEPASLMDRVESALKCSTVDLYVPPYMLPLCNEMKRFEDFTGDGSVTKQSVEEGAIKIQRQIDAKGAVGVEMPDVVSTYCREVLSDPNTELFDKSENCSRDAYMLSAFGWSLCDEDGSAGDVMGAVMKCNLCLSKSVLASAAPTMNAESPKKKKRRIDTLKEANIKVLESHRAYCPNVSGFARGVSDQSKPGWKVVLSNLRK
mmetsp:Transcript_20588/g.30899  ORF Transcript_20588/g.30899 Transcript_20588/m.30899 type:complete len:373 (+) Transcript_20588:44-1162(+)